MDFFMSKAKRRHLYFMRLLEEREVENSQLHRILLIGTGESGKSTFVKQLKLLSSPNKTLPNSYKENFTNEILRNLIQSLSRILKFMQKIRLSFANESQKLEFAKKSILHFDKEIERYPDSIIKYARSENSEENNFFFDACKMIWNDSNVRSCIARQHEFQLMDSAAYFLDKIDIIRNPNYLPSDDDVLKCRTKTYGIHSETIYYNGVNFELIDVGGQRDQRAKWIEAMSDGVTAVIFLTDISAYDSNLIEDETVNRLKDSIQLLGQVWKKAPLADKSIILFLNKQDKLEAKIRDQTSLFEDYFPEYYDGSLKFLWSLLTDIKGAYVNKRSDKLVWEKVFGYFLIRRNANEDDLVKTEYSEIKNVVRSWLDTNPKECLDGVCEKWSEKILQTIRERPDFISLQNRLSQIAFYQIVCITNIATDLFISQCEQTARRKVYSYPTTAIDRRNIDHVFDSCKLMLQGKAISDIIGK